MKEVRRYGRCADNVAGHSFGRSLKFLFVDGEMIVKSKNRSFPDPPAAEFSKQHKTNNTQKILNGQGNGQKCRVKKRERQKEIHRQ